MAMLGGSRVPRTIGILRNLTFHRPVLVHLGDRVAIPAHYSSDNETKQESDDCKNGEQERDDVGEPQGLGCDEKYYLARED